MNVPLSNFDIERALRTTTGFIGVYSYDLLPRINNGQFLIANTDNVLPTYDEPEGGHHWVTIARDNDRALVFDSFGRSLQEMEFSYTEPKLEEFVLKSLPDCTVYTSTQVIQNNATAVCGHYAILVGKLFSRYGSIDTVLEILAKTFSHDTLANDKLILTMNGRGRWTDQLADELHRPKRKTFPRRRVYSKGIDHIWSADLVDMQAFSRQNRGFKYLFTIIDVFSKFAWVLPLKNKTGKAITAAFSSVLKKSKRKPQKFWSDMARNSTTEFSKTF